MAEAESNGPFSNRRPSFIIVAVGMIFLAGFSLVGTTSSASTTACFPNTVSSCRPMQEIAVLNFGGVGSFTNPFNSTFAGSLGVGVNFTIPNPSWNLPFAFTQGCCLTNILLWITGQITVSIGSPNATSPVTALYGICISTIGIPVRGASATDDCPVGADAVEVGPSSPFRSNGATGNNIKQKRITVPLNAYKEVGCSNPPVNTVACTFGGTFVYVYPTIKCDTFFTGIGSQIANSCAFWGKGVNGWDLGNMTVVRGRLQVFA